MVSWEQRNTEPWRNALIGFARDASPYEACGVITDTGMVVQCRNLVRTTDPHRPEEFHMDPDELLRVWEYTAAIWHTHPNGSLQPSTRDTAGHPNTNVDGNRLGMVIATADDVGVVIPW